MDGPWEGGRGVETLRNGESEGGGGLKRGENPWAEAREGRGRDTRWGTQLTIPERLEQVTPVP